MLIWIDRKNRLPSCELAAMIFGINLSPPRILEKKDTSLKSWSGCKWKKTSLDLLPHVVEGMGTDDTFLIVIGCRVRW